MSIQVHATERERREWTCPSCGELIDPRERFHFLVEYQRFMEAPPGPIQDLGTRRPPFACRRCRELAELAPAGRREGSPWALWLAVALIPVLAGMTILGIIANWLAG